jgi:hypothetical protein
MPVISDCPGCGRKVRVPDSLLGKAVKCTGCGTSFVVDGGGPAGGADEEPAGRPTIPLREEEHVAEQPRASRRPAPQPDEYEPWEDNDEDDRRPRRRRRRRDSARAAEALTPPAIFLLVVGILGLLAAMGNMVFALALKPPPVDPNAPAFLQQMQQGGFGPLAAAIQGIWVIVNLVILAGAVQMMRRQTWGLGLAASILAMINLGSCCLLLGIPAGIWSLVVLLRPEVKDAFG